MRIKISNSKITVSDKTVIDNRGKEDVVLNSLVRFSECKCSEECENLDGSVIKCKQGNKK